MGVLAAVVQEIVRRHESLRTTFAATEGEPVQVIAPELRLEVPVIDLAALPEAVREAEAQRLILFEERLPLDLARGPLLRVSVLRHAERRHAVRFTMHHIVSDGWSVNIFFRELVTLYGAFADGLPSPLPELPVQYADFVVWQRGWLQGEVLERHLDYWRRQLDGAPPLLALPTDRPRPPVQTLRGGHRRIVIPAGTTQSLRTLGQREGASLFMVLAAALTALLARYSGQDDVSLGTYSGNRGRAELEGLIGFFISTLVLRTDLSDGPGFRTLVQRMRETALGAFSHQDLPFEKLLETLKVERDLSHTPLFQVHFLLQNFPSQTVDDDLPDSDLDLRPAMNANDHANYDLSFELSEAEDEVRGTVQHNLVLFEPATVDRMIRHLLALAAAAVREPEAPIHELPLLDPAERRQLLVDWSGASVSPAPEAPVHELVARRAAEMPGEVAVEAGDRQWTYRELADRASKLAQHLRRLGVMPEVRVGIVAERSPELLAGMLAVLAAGGAYVPLDPGHPEDRLAWMLEDAGIPFLLTRGATPAWAGSAQAISLDGGAWEDEETSPPSFPIDPGSAAYLIYTSGSTGQPKGVVVEHRSLAAYARDAAAVYGIGPGDRVLQFASLGFDTSAEEIWPALARGATLVLRSDQMIASPERFAAELGRLGITVLNLPTAYWHELAAGLDGQPLPEALRLVVIGGEKALAERLDLWRESTGARLVNTYGPTEATIVSTRREIGPGEDLAEIPLGRPIAGSRVHVVDRRLQAVPQGVIGELLVGGAGLARGYLGRPGLTAAAFVPDPFGNDPGARLYRTGDLARFLPAGELEFLGRIDRQVKVRGFRVEPGEIESVLSGHPGLHAAAVDVRPGPSGALRLIAWVVPAGGPPTSGELRRHLAGRLPEPLLPSVFVTVDALPLNRSGKVDRDALPDPEGDRPHLEHEYLAPEGPVEEALAAIWAEVLGVARVGVQDNFFELGGHSLLATQVVARIRERLKIDLQLISLFQMPTVEQLAVVVEEAVLDRLEALGEEEVRELL